MDFNIAVLGGDGIGPEVTDQGVRVLEAVGRAFGHSFSLSYGDIGGISIDKHGVPLTDETIGLLDSNDAVLFGAVGGPKWDSPDAKVQPERGLLDMRAHMGVFANIRPVKVYPWLADSSAMVNHYYFYCVDRDFGLFFLKFCSYFPYGAKPCLNGHEYLKKQLANRDIDFEPLDNGLLTCAYGRPCGSRPPTALAASHRLVSRCLPSPTRGENRATEICVRAWE